MTAPSFRSRRALLVAAALLAAVLGGRGLAPGSFSTAAAPSTPAAPNAAAVLLAQASVEATDPAGSAANPSEGAVAPTSRYPLVVLGIGIAAVLGLIIGLKVNAFLALILSALLVSLLTEGEAGERMNAVVKAFGAGAEQVGILIAMAAIIGKCLLDSGAADRVVRSAVALTGPRQASTGLMGSGFILGVPVFFDTVFYLLVPLARSLFRQTGKNYLRYLMAIATGGAITHTLVPPTPGPLLVGANLGVDVGVMMIVGILVALPSALIGLGVAVLIDRVMPVPMRPLGGQAQERTPVSEGRLPSLPMALLPVVLPVLLIGSGTLATTLADMEDRAELTRQQIPDFEALRETIRTEAAEPAPTPASRLLQSPRMSEEGRAMLLQTEPLAEEDRAEAVAAINEALLDIHLYDEEAFAEVPLSPLAQEKIEADASRMKSSERRRMNRVLLEDAYGGLIEPHVWDSPRRQWADRLTLWGNPNFALMLAALVAILMLKRVRMMSFREVGAEVESALMSGGVIILITAAGAAFGAMLKEAGVGEAIQGEFRGASAGGIQLLLLGYLVAAVLKIAQGSSTVAMIVASGMMAGMLTGADLGYHAVYLGTVIGSGSLFGSWMNDSGFWVFAKMGGLTEGEALRSWTVLLIVLSVSGLFFSLLLSQLLPMTG